MTTDEGCGWCHRGLGPDSSSPDFCNETCQTSWMRAQRKSSKDKALEASVSARVAAISVTRAGDRRSPFPGGNAWTGGGRTYHEVVEVGDSEDNLLIPLVTNDSYDISAWGNSVPIRSMLIEMPELRRDEVMDLFWGGQDWRSMPPGPERVAAKNAVFQRLYSGPVVGPTDLIISDVS